MAATPRRQRTPDDTKSQVDVAVKGCAVRQLGTAPQSKVHIVRRCGHRCGDGTVTDRPARPVGHAECHGTSRVGHALQPNLPRREHCQCLIDPVQQEILREHRVFQPMCLPGVDEMDGVLVSLTAKPEASLVWWRAEAPARRLRAEGSHRVQEGRRPIKKPGCSAFSRWGLLLDVFA